MKNPAVVLTVSCVYSHQGGHKYVHNNKNW